MVGRRFAPDPPYELAPYANWLGCQWCMVQFAYRSLFASPPYAKRRVLPSSGLAMNALGMPILCSRLCAAKVVAGR